MLVVRAVMLLFLVYSGCCAFLFVFSFSFSLYFGPSKVHSMLLCIALLWGWDQNTAAFRAKFSDAVVRCVPYKSALRPPSPCSNTNCVCSPPAQEVVLTKALSPGMRRWRTLLAHILNHWLQVNWFSCTTWCFSLMSTAEFSQTSSLYR